MRVMIIGAKWEQIPLIMQAKLSGHFVISTDPQSDAEGREISDAFEILNPRNLSDALEIAKKYKVDGVVADECDYSRFASVYLNIVLGLGGRNNNFNAAQYTGNKLWMRECCREHQIFQPRFISCKSYDEAVAALSLIGLPVIVKPVDNRGSAGVHHVTDLGQLLFAFYDAVSNAHSRLVLVEAYIEGLHITVDGCFDQNGLHHNLAFASKKLLEGQNPVITEVYYPAKIDQDTLDHVADANNKVIQALGISDGLTHSEFIVDVKGRCFLVETANRGGGVLTSAKIIPELSGVNTSALLIANSLGQNYNIQPAHIDLCVCLHFFVFRPGVIKSISGIDDVRSLSTVIHVQINAIPGTLIGKPKSGSERHGFVIVRGSSMDDVYAEIQKIEDCILLEYEEV